jgi:hypothetical protein
LPAVLSSYKDFPGYTDNVNGPSGIIAWAARGYIHIIFGDASKRANLIPIDYCINALIATAWDIHETYVNLRVPSLFARQYAPHHHPFLFYLIAGIRSD